MSKLKTQIYISKVKSYILSNLIDLKYKFEICDLRFEIKKLLLGLLFFILILPVNAVESANNIFGIHLAQPQLEAIREASDLVNSNGGKWGYVTLVIQENDRDVSKWQSVFDSLRELHLIPIIRIATSAEGENWRRPEKKDADQWINFLNSLNWVVKNRYIILFNEPNHGSEWGGEVDEKSFAEVIFEFAKKFKEKNSDYFIMMAGFDASAPSWVPGMEDEETFLRRISNFQFPISKQTSNNQQPTSKTVFDYIDGWASHSYPNPGFSGSPLGRGRGSVRTYEWELDLLKDMGVSKNLPVFITETGWKRSKSYGLGVMGYLDESSVAENDERVKAVTPFVLDYQTDPFLEFSWKLPSAKASEEQGFYQQYYTVQSISKVKGEPGQIEKGKISFDLPRELVAQSKYNFRVTLKNQGQGVWDRDDSYELKVMNDELRDSVLVSEIKDIKPGEEKIIDFSLKTIDEKEKKETKFSIIKNGKNILESKSWAFKVLPLPDLNVKVRFWPYGNAWGDDFEIQIFDIDDKLVFKKKGVKITNGEGIIKNVQNIALDELYRVVILKPGYLPRQNFIVFKSQDNTAEFKRMLPFDLNSDGKFDFKDLLKPFGR